MGEHVHVRYYSLKGIIPNATGLRSPAFENDKSISDYNTRTADLCIINGKFIMDLNEHTVLEFDAKDILSVFGIEIDS